MPCRIVDDEQRRRRRAWAEQLAGAAFAPTAHRVGCSAYDRRSHLETDSKPPANAVIGSAWVLQRAASLSYWMVRIGSR